MNNRVLGKDTMRICMLVYSFYESDNRVLRYCETLLKRGHEVDVICLRRPHQVREEAVGRLRLFRLQDRAREEKGKLDYVRRIVRFTLRSALLIGRLHWRDRYDLIHVHNLPDFLVFSALLPKLLGAKIVLDIHDVLPEMYTRKFSARPDGAIFRSLVWIERLSILFADHVLVANHLWEERLVSRSVPAQKCTTIFNAPDLEVFKRSGRTRCDGRFVIVYPGSLNAHQGVDVAIRAMPMILRQIPNAELHIYGRGAAKEGLVGLIEALGLRGKVMIGDMLPARAVVKVIENADIGVEPKRAGIFSDEAFSTKILEYMALGVPAVVANTKIHRHYLNSSVVRFFGDGNYKELAESIIALAEDRDARMRLIKNGDSLVSRHNWQVQEKEYLQVLSSLTLFCQRSLTAQAN